MPKHSQDGRFMAVSTPLGKDALLLETLSGVEAISDLFEFDLGLLAEAGTEVAFDQLLGQPVTVGFALPNGGQRFVNGIVNRLAEGAQVPGPVGGVSFVRYRATVVPKLWLLTKRTNSRIFQQISVPDILRKVFTGLDVDWSGLQGTFEPRDYCVQYRETDFAFASRLMEEEGIYYYFTHADGAHTMVVANTPQGHAAVPGPTTLRFEGAVGGTRPQDTDRVYGWVKTQEIRAGKQTLWDHSFELTQPPGFQNLEAIQRIQQSVAAGSVTHKLTAGGGDALELYDYPGGYAQRFDGVPPGGGDRPADVQKIFQDNARTTGIRMQQEAAGAMLIVGESTARHLTAGHKFTLSEHFNANGQYVVTRVEHQASLIGAYTRDEAFDTGYRNGFHCAPAALPYRPAQVTPKARVWGTHTATVVGPAGEEIFTDKYARVKVQFHWDREGKKDANSSCWIRVATHWAGKQWGAIHIPRIGQEVIVAFEEGDPDRPIIVGSVYNAEQMPPEKLPDDRTISGIKSRSSLQGTPANYNQLMFEDKKGQEYIYFHAERDFHRVVENDDHTTVGFDTMSPGNQFIDVFNNQQTVVGAESGDSKPADGSQLVYVWNNRELVVGNGEADALDGSELISIWKNQEVTIGKGKAQCGDGSQLVSIFKNQEITVGSGQGQCGDGSQQVTIYKDRTVTLQTGNDKLTVSKGNRDVVLDMGNDKHHLKMGNRDVVLDMGNDALTIKMGNQTTKLSLGASKTEAMQSITLKVGGNSIVVDQTGVTIKGLMVKVEGQVMTEVKGLMTQVNGSAMLTAKGGITMIN